MEKALSRGPLEIGNLEKLVGLVEPSPGDKHFYGTDEGDATRYSNIVLSENSNGGFSLKTETDSGELELRSHHDYRFRTSKAFRNETDIGRYGTILFIRYPEGETSIFTSIRGTTLVKINDDLNQEIVANPDTTLVELFFSGSKLYVEDEEMSPTRVNTLNMPPDICLELHRRAAFLFDAYGYQESLKRSSA